MNIWLINHYAVLPRYYPLARTTNFAKYLMRMGHTVTIFAASSVHNSDANLITDGALYREETVDDIHYVYVRCRTYNGNGIQRIINMFEFPRRLKWVCDRFPKPDAVLASSATPPACMAGLKLAKQYGARAVAEISDLWPLSFVDYGLISARNPVLIPMYAYEKRMYKVADAVIFTMEGAYDYIKERGWEKDIPRDKVHYINNGVDLEAFRYNREHFWLEDPDLDDPDTIKIVYTGSIRLTNGVGALVDTAKQVTNPKIKFLVWGDGDQLSGLRRKVLDEGIGNVVFKGRVEKKYIPSIVSRADYNLVDCVDSGVFRFGISPNKLFDYFAAGKPVLMCLQAKYNPAEQFSCGLICESPEKLGELLEKIPTLSKDEYDALSQGAVTAAREYDFRNLTRKLLAVIEGAENT